MIELHDNECIRIDATFAILGTVEGMASLTGINPQEAADNYRTRRMPLVWTTIAPGDQGIWSPRPSTTPRSSCTMAKP